MSDVSTHNYYYRYLVLKPSDLSLETFNRRLTKAQQNTTTCLLYDLTDLTKMLTNSEIALTKNHSFKSQYLIRADQISSLNFSETMIQLCNQNDIELFKKQNLKNPLLPRFLFSPATTIDLKHLLAFSKSLTPAQKDLAYWDFKPYQPQIKKSLTLKDIYSCEETFRRLPGLEIWNSHIPENFELEGVGRPCWEFRTPQRKLHISFIIPSFNNISFLANVLKHLCRQNLSPENFEVIIVEDGGLDGSAQFLRELFECYRNKINLKMIYWSKVHADKGKQNFFRAGLARNLASQYAEAELLFFLDSDILTPPDFAKICLQKLEKYDLIQFERRHIKQDLSLLNPQFQQVNLSTDTYIEEAAYWSSLFKSTDWMSLPNHWKYTCTYALGLRKTDFLATGRFKKYYVSYGFEDTDLGYEMFLRNKTSHLVQTPLLHLTAYDQMQYKNSQIKRLQLLRKTAALFYLQHLNPKIYELFGNFYRFEKPLYQTLRDLI